VVRVQAIKEGFRGAAMFESTFDQATLTLDKDHPVRDLSLHLRARARSLDGSSMRRRGAGRAREDRRLPGQLPGRTARLHSRCAIGEIDDEGRFALRNLPATDIVVARFRPHSVEDGHILTRFEPADVERVDSDFERTWWPGGRDEESTFPIPLGSGQTLDIGQIAVRKVPSIGRKLRSRPHPAERANSCR